MDRTEKCGKKFAELFGGKPVKDEGTDPEFMRILQRFIFGEVSYTGSLDDRMRELVTVTVLVVNQTLPQLKAAADVKVEHMIISVDRMERGQSGTTAIKEIGAEFGIKVHPIVTVRDIIEHLHNRELDGKVILDDEIRARMEKYLETYCEI